MPIMRLWCLKGTQVRNIQSVFAIVEIRGNGTLGYRTMQMFPRPWKCFTHSHNHTHTHLFVQPKRGFNRWDRSLGRADIKTSIREYEGRPERTVGREMRRSCGPQHQGGCYSRCTDPLSKVQQTQNLQNWRFTPQIWCNANIPFKYISSSSRAPDSLAIAVMKIWKYNCLFWIIDAKLVGIRFFFNAFITIVVS